MIVDEWFVKPTGVLAAKRYKRVLVSDAGVVTTEPVPGKPDMNLPCISDYKTTNRRFKSGDLITEFCNFQSHVNYRIYAQDCDPFVTVQTDINAPKCGYLQPPPQPFVPFNPWGNPVYTLQNFFDFCDIDGLTTRVEILSKCYAGLPQEIQVGGGSPVIIEWMNETDDIFYPFRSCVASITFMADLNFQMRQFYTQDQRAFKVNVYKEGNLKFSGFMIPSTASEPFISPPYPVTLKATAGINTLKRVDYPMPTGVNTDTRQSFLEVITYCLRMTNLDLDIQTICNMYERKMTNAPDDDPLLQASINPMRWIEGGSIASCYQVLEDVCREFSAYLTQVEGKWTIVRVSEIANEQVRRRTYNYTGLFLFADILDNLQIAGNKEYLQILAGGSLPVYNAIKRVVVDLQYGKTPTILYNGGFELWDGQNFEGWTRYGNISINRVQLTIPGVSGVPVPINDYAVRFNERATPSKYLQAIEMIASAGQKATLNFKVRQSESDKLFLFRVKVGEYYLYNDPKAENPEFKWVKELTTATVNVYDGAYKGFYRSVSVNLPPLPVDGSMFIQLFGFNYIVVLDRVGKPYPAPTYVPGDLTEIGISITDSNTLISGIYFISEQDEFFTDEPEPIVIKFGDHVGLDKPRPARAPQPVGQNILYSIYTKDGSYSTGWKEYGSQGEYLPIGAAAARTILNAKRKPYYFFEGSFKSAQANYLTSFNFNVPGQPLFNQLTFIQNNTSYDLKTNIISGSFVQISNQGGIFTNGQLPKYEGVELPPFSQNPNMPCPLPEDGIFQGEFTEQFM